MQNTIGYAMGQPFGSPSGFTRGTGEDELNKFNQWMRSQPWHQQFLQSIGQSGRNINLSESQQKQLARVAQQNGVNLPADDLSVDQAGNLNQNSRLGRNLMIAGIVGAGVLTGGMALGAFGAAGAAGAGGAAGASGAAAGGVGAGLGGGAAAAGGMGSLGAMLAPSLIANGTQAALGIYGAHAQGNANKDAMAMQQEGNAAQLAFLKEQAAEDKRRFDATQAQNLGIYNDERDYTRGLETQRRSRLAPYVQLGRNAMGQLAQPMARGRVSDLL